VTRTSQPHLLKEAQEKVEHVVQHIDDAVRQAGPTIQKMARLGHIAEGLAYLMVGTLAGMAAAGVGGRTASVRGLMAVLVRHPAGLIVLGVLTLGFGSFGIWQCLRAIRDPDNEGTSWKALAKRFGYFWSGLCYFALVVGAIEIALLHRARDLSGDANIRGWTAIAMSYPLGRWIVAAIGIGMIVYAASHGRKAWQLNPDKELHTHELSKHSRRVACWVGRFGVAARGVVFFIIGCFLFLAAWHQHPREARGVGGALATLEGEPFGALLLGIVAAGLIAYGSYALYLAGFRRITTK